MPLKDDRLYLGHARRVSKEFCDTNPQIPWKAIIGMRHKVVHDYFDVDDEIVWDTVKEELEPLVKQLENTVSKAGM